MIAKSLSFIITGPRKGFGCEGAFLSNTKLYVPDNRQLWLARGPCDVLHASHPERTRALAARSEYNKIQEVGQEAPKMETRGIIETSSAEEASPFPEFGRLSKLKNTSTQSDGIWYQGKRSKVKHDKAGFALIFARSMD